MYKIIKKLRCIIGINSHTITMFCGDENALLYLDDISDQELLDIFWSAYILDDESKEHLVTYMNKCRGYNLRIFRGEMIGGQYQSTEQWDGENWITIDRDVDSMRDKRLKDKFKFRGNDNAE